MKRLDLFYYKPIGRLIHGFQEEDLPQIGEIIRLLNWQYLAFI